MTNDTRATGPTRALKAMVTTSASDASTLDPTDRQKSWSLAKGSATSRFQVRMRRLSAGSLARLNWRARSGGPKALSLLGLRSLAAEIQRTKSRPIFGE